jgi:hypothetical protein
MAFEAMRAAASHLGWQLVPPDPGLFDMYSMVSIHGSEDGIPVRLDRCASAYQFTTNAFVNPPVPFDFIITAEGIGDALAHFVGFHDVAIGDPVFDKRFKLVSSEPERLKRLLTPELKAALEALHAATKPLGFRGFSVTPTVVNINRVYPTTWITESNVMLDIPTVVATVRALHRAARAAA